MATCTQQPATEPGQKHRIEAGLSGRRRVAVFATTWISVVRWPPKSPVGDDVAVQPLMFQAGAAARIQNEHVCRALDVSRLDVGTPLTLMERLDSENLRSFQASEPIAAAHAAGGEELTAWGVAALVQPTGLIWRA